MESNTKLHQLDRCPLSFGKIRVNLTAKSQAAIKDQLETLIDAGLLTRYTYGPSEGKRDLPAQFYGFTERGVEVLHDYNYLRGLPVARALYEKHAQDRENRAPRIGPSTGASGCRRGSPRIRRARSRRRRWWHEPIVRRRTAPFSTLQRKYADFVPC